MATGDPLARSGIISQAIRAGLSANKTLGLLKDAGLGVRRETFLNLYADVLGSLGKREAVATADLNSYPEAEHFGTWDASRKSQYLYQVEIQTRTPGTSDISTSFYGVTSDTLLTYGAALATALGDATDNESRYGETVLGGMVVGIYGP